MIDRSYERPAEGTMQSILYDAAGHRRSRRRCRAITLLLGGEDGRPVGLSLPGPSGVRGQLLWRIRLYAR
jgi:hypothetical protein